VTKWKHTLYDWLDLKGRAAEMAVLAELMLRGPQTEGDLRVRAGRMDPLPDLPALHAVLEFLAGRGLVIYLTPPGQKRGVIVTHGLYPPDELEKVRQAHAGAALAEDDEPRTLRAAGPPAPALAAEVTALRTELDALKNTVQALAAEVQALKASLGA
jgi:uncharacterized protein